MQIFDYVDGRDATEKDFRIWRTQYPKWFIIQPKDGTFMLHLSDCSSFDYKDTTQVTLTRKAKRCSSDREELEAWAKEQNVMPLLYCSRCMKA